MISEHPFQPGQKGIEHYCGHAKVTSIAYGVTLRVPCMSLVNEHVTQVTSQAE